MRYVLPLLLVLLSSVHAQEAKKLTLQECRDIMSALMALDGYTALDKDGKSVSLQYKLGDLRLPIANNMTALRSIVKDGDTAHAALLRELLPNGTPQSGTPEYNKFMAQDAGAKEFTGRFQKMLDALQNVTLARFKLSDLRLGDGKDQNAIPPSVLSALAPILDP